MALKSTEKIKYNKDSNKNIIKSRHKTRKNNMRERMAAVSNQDNSANAMALSTCCPQYQYYPLAYTEWRPLVPMTCPVPMLMHPAPVMSTPAWPFSPPLPAPPMMPAPTVPLPRATPPMVGPPPPNLLSPIYDAPSEPESSGTSSKANDSFKEISDVDPLAYYLALPKNLFPPARRVMIDPNDLIDEFCKLPDIHKHVPWALDLEFGVPKLPITRPIPCYNVKFNSIHCKNAPDAIHPGFESCSQDFKRVFLFYFDCVVSVWYRSYVYMTNDKSVENFQAWLMFPMQELGLSWS